MLKPFLTAAIIALLPLAGAAAAEKGHSHEEARKGPMAASSGLEAELVVGPDAVAVYLYDHGEAPAGADIVLSLRAKDGKTGQVRYDLGGHSH